MEKFEEIKKRLVARGRAVATRPNDTRWFRDLSTVASKMYFGRSNAGEAYAALCADGDKAYEAKLIAAARLAIYDATASYYDLDPLLNLSRIRDLANASSIHPTLYAQLQLCGHAEYRVKAGDAQWVINYIEANQLHSAVEEKLVEIVERGSAVPAASDAIPTAPAARSSRPFEGSI